MNTSPIATIKLNTKHLLACLAFAADEDIRYYLNGVCIETTESGVGYMVATDGHRMLVCEIPELEKEHHRNAQYIIPKEALHVLKGHASREIFLPGEQGEGIWVSKLAHDLIDTLFQVKDGHCELTFEALTFRCTLIEGKFPKWRKVIPTEFDGIGCRFNTDYMHDLSKVGELLFGKTSIYKFPCMLHNSASSQVLAVWDREGVFALTMAMKQDEMKSSPGWIVDLGRVGREADKAEKAVAAESVK